MKKKVKKGNFRTDAIYDLPERAWEMVNKYGTYEIQSTADTENEYPAIAQGLAKKDRDIVEDQKT